MSKSNEELQNEEQSTVDSTVDATAAESVESTEATSEETTPSLEAVLAEEKDKFLRLFAEFENYKRRTAKERLDLYKTANEEMMVAMLPVLDDFDRALHELKKSADESVLTGVTLIYDKFHKTLLSKGLAVVEVAAGDAFNSDLAEAITQIPMPDMTGKVVDVIEKGYKLGEKIIRYPKVVVGQ